jgi:acyl-coenzyme A thioesterase PaaI-like protein
MSLLRNLVARLPPRYAVRALALYPPYLGAGIRCTGVAPDLSWLEVEMKLRGWNQNYVGTQFGGSLYSMCDPFFMLMLMSQLGPGFVVWDKAATVEFLRPGRATVQARFEVSPERVAEVRAEVARAGKSHPRFEVEVKHLDGEVVARVGKVLSVRPYSSSKNRSV